MGFGAQSSGRALLSGEMGTVEAIGMKDGRPTATVRRDDGSLVTLPVTQLFLNRFRMNIGAGDLASKERWIQPAQ